MMKTNDKVIIVKPDNLAGRVATKNGDPFRYPSQNFWVHPVILLNGEKVLALYVKEFPMNSGEGADYINGFLSSKIALNLNPDIVYDYQTLLAGACCPSCGEKIEWKLAKEQTDKFCAAECCGMMYGMVPEAVRVVSVPLASACDPTRHELSATLADNDFLRELEKL
jgi:hypothetical protein